MEADVGKPARFDRGECLRHAVDEGFAADEADARVGRRRGDQVLSPAEADLQPHVRDGLREQCAQIAGRRRGHIDREARQQRFEQRGLMRPQRVALAPAEEGAVFVRSGLHPCCRGQLAYLPSW